MQYERIQLRLPQPLLKAADEWAKQDYSTRTEFVRKALVNQIRTEQALARMLKPITRNSLSMEGKQAKAPDESNNTILLTADIWIEALTGNKAVAKVLRRIAEEGVTVIMATVIVDEVRTQLRSKRPELLDGFALLLEVLRPRLEWVDASDDLAAAVAGHAGLILTNDQRRQALGVYNEDILIIPPETW